MDKIQNELSQYRGKYFSSQWPTIYEMFSISAARFPQRPCFTTFDPHRKTLTYAQVDELIKKAAAHMISAGVRKGDKVTLNGKNSVQWAIAYLAINYIGAVIVPIDNQLHIDRVQRLASFADSVYLIADFDVISKMDKEDEWFRSLKGMMCLKGHMDGADNIMELEEEQIYPSQSHECEDLAAILFTSGTTGNEKGAMLSNKNIVSDVYAAACDMNVKETDVLYALLPLHHSYACTTVLLETVKHGAECVFGHGIIVSRMIADMKMGKVTVFMGIPLLYNKVIAGIMKKVKEKGAFTYGLIKTLMAINGWCKVHFGKAPLKGFFQKKITSQVGLDNANYCIQAVPAART